MTRRLAILAIGALGLLLPAAGAWARGYGSYSNTPPMTPYGPLYDPKTMQQAGYNPLVYEQIIMQKMAVAQQQAFMKQQQAFQKMQKNQGTIKNTPVFQQPRNIIPPRRRVSKKARGKKNTTITESADKDKEKDTDKSGAEAADAKSPSAAKAAAKPASTAKPKS